MSAPTTHWSTTGRLHTGTVDGCGACEAELLASYRAHVGYKPTADEVVFPDDAALDATARTWSRTGQNHRESDSLPPLAAEQAAEGKSLGCDSRDAQEGAQ